ncbi:MAG: aldolase catalytic domain-containing protein [Clostridia bacterium]|nr:aldolase catalytic domain-containing protein [Clostridia bacterium]
MAQKGNLMIYRPDIKVLDATIRDGGLVNNFFFTDDFVKALYQANIKAGVDYMEFGYKASKDLFDEKAYGKWKFCEEEDIRAIVGENNTDLKISVMADVGRTDYKRDIIDKKDSVIDMIRVATYINTIPAAIDMIEYCHNKGYETCVNIMAVSTADSRDVEQALEMLGKSSVDVIYLVDSYGSLYPEQVRELTETYCAVAEKYGKKVGMHAHNNQQMAFANTVESVAFGASYLDATMMGMGRGAGNCILEGILGFLRNPRYNVVYVLKFIQEYMLPLKEQGLIWGYEIPYLLTGMLNRHPGPAIDKIKMGDKNYVGFYHVLWDREN